MSDQEGDAAVARFHAEERRREREYREAEQRRALDDARRWREVLAGARNTDAEESVLGGVILHNEALVVLDDLTTGDFWDPRNAFVYAAMRNLEARGQPVDVVMLEEQLARDGKLDAVGGVARLGELALRVPTVDNVEWYKDVVREHSVTRQVLEAASEVPGYVSGGLVHSGSDLLDEVVARFARIERASLQSEMLTIASVVEAEDDAIEKWIAEPESRNLPRLPWRIKALDDETGGVPIGLVTVLGARPGVGKTTMLINFAMRRELDEPGIVFTNEDDPREDLASKFIAWEAQLDSRRVRERDLSTYEHELRRRARASIKARLPNVRLVRAAGMTSKEMVRIAVADQRKRGTRWVAVDYLQNMPREANTKITYAIRADMQRFQVAALEHRLAWMVCSQISRESAKEKDQQGKVRRPALYDFRDSGAIEECGKLILALHPNPEKPDDQVEVVNLKNVRGASRSWVDLLVNYSYSHLGDLPPGRAALAPTPSSTRGQRALPSPPPQDDVPHYADGGR